MPATLNAKIELFAGNKRTLRFTVRNGDLPKVAGVHPVLDITGLAFRWALSRGKSSLFVTTADVLKSTASAAEIDLTNPTIGELEVYLVGVDTVTLVGDFYQELEAVDGLSESLVVGRGDVKVIANVSNVA